MSAISIPISAPARPARCSPGVGVKGGASGRGGDIPGPGSCCPGVAVGRPLLAVGAAADGPAEPLRRQTGCSARLGGRGGTSRVPSGGVKRALNSTARHLLPSLFVFCGFFFFPFPFPQSCILRALRLGGGRATCCFLPAAVVLYSSSTALLGVRPREG